MGLECATSLAGTVVGCRRQFDVSFVAIAPFAMMQENVLG